MLTLEEESSEHDKDLEEDKCHNTVIQETVFWENESTLPYAFSSLMLGKFLLLTREERSGRVYFLMGHFIYL